MAAVAWFLVLITYTGNGAPVVMPAPYPTEQACVSAAMTPQQKTEKSGRVFGYLCVPAPSQTPTPRKDHP